VTRNARFNALEGAATVGDLKTFHLLMSAGLKPQNVISASMMGHRAIVDAALEAGADLKVDGGHAGQA
jgi:hypothetical protein